jgi:putative aldouronate transport system permease protein
MKEGRNLKLKKPILFDLVNNTILLIIALLCVYPFLYVLFIAISNGTFLARGEVSFLPKGVNLESFRYILTNHNLSVFTGLKNSFIYTIVGTLVAIVTTYFTAYVLSRPRFKHRYWIMSLFVITWVFEAGIIPQFIVYNAFGFVDNPAVMIIPGAISTQFLIIAKTFLDGVPKELEEAAFVDGANDWVIMTRIYMPLCTTLFATVGTFYAISIWNQYLLPQIYLKSENLQTIQQVLKSVVITDSTSGTTFKNVIVNGITLNQQNLKAAAVFTAMLPIVCLYPFVQKYFKKGILLGSVKG